MTITASMESLRATALEAASEAARESVTPTDVLDGYVGPSALQVSEEQAFFLSCKAFAARTGHAPTEAQISTLLRQVQAGFIDGQQARVDHGQAIVLPKPKPASQIARERAEAAALKIDGLTIAEAAEFTGLSERAIRARVDRGSLQAWKGPDNRRRIPRRYLEPLVEHGRADDSTFEALAAQLDNTSSRIGPMTPIDTSFLKSGRGSGSGVIEANEAAAGFSPLVLTFWEKAEKAVREATEQRMLTQFAETRLAEAEKAAERLEQALHEARSEAAVAKAEAERLRQRVQQAEVVMPESAGIPGKSVESTGNKRRWFRRGS